MNSLPTSPSRLPSATRSLPALAAVAVIGTVVIAGVAGGFGGSDGGDDPQSASTDGDVVDEHDVPLDRSRSPSSRRPRRRHDPPRPAARHGAWRATRCARSRSASTSSASSSATIDGQFGNLTSRPCGRSRSSCCRRAPRRGHGRRHRRDVAGHAAARSASSRAAGTPRARRPSNHIEVYLPGAGRRVLRRRQGGADQPHVERRRRGVERGRDDRPRRVRQRERHRAARARRDRRVGHAGRGVPVSTGWSTGCATAPSAGCGTGLLQLRHRHPRRPQRAAPPGVARLHPHAADGRRDVPPVHRQRRPGVRVGRRQGARGLRPEPRRRLPAGSAADLQPHRPRRTRPRPRRRSPTTTVAPTVGAHPGAGDAGSDGGRRRPRRPAGDDDHAAAGDHRSAGDHVDDATPDGRRLTATLGGVSRRRPRRRGRGPARATPCVRRRRTPRGRCRRRRRRAPG